MFESSQRGGLNGVLSLEDIGCYGLRIVPVEYTFVIPLQMDGDAEPICLVDGARICRES